MIPRSSIFSIGESSRESLLGIIPNQLSLSLTVWKDVGATAGVMGVGPILRAAEGAGVLPAQYGILQGVREAKAEMQTVRGRPAPPTIAERIGQLSERWEMRCRGSSY